MYVKQIYTGCLAQASYYVESKGEAIIIDPIRDNKLYLEILKKRKSNLKYIFETHFHADFVSGHIDLTKLTNSKIVFGPGAKTEYDIIEAKDYQQFNFGDLTIKVLHTPGHTLESVCYLLLSENGSKEAIFTGDTLFVGEVGRPDLAVNPELKRELLAGLLYDSLHNVLMKLPDSVVVYPGHGAGSACGKNISSDKVSTIGYQREFNYALQKMSKKQFINIVLDGLLEPPSYFKHDVLMNQQGYDSISTLLERSLIQLKPYQIQNSINDGAIILDVRLPHDFEHGFIPKSINVGKTGMFAPWVATILSPTKDIIIVCYENEEKEIVSRLARVGFENIIGYTYGIADWQQENNNIDTIESVSPMTLNYENKIKFLDVRKVNELHVGSVPNSINIPLSQINNNLNNLNKRDNYLVYCAGGYRSMIACSILKSQGYAGVKNIHGGFNAIAQTIK